MSDKTKVTGLEQVTNKLTQLSYNLKNLRPVLAGLGNIIENVTDESFENQASPWGERWRKNTVRTIHKSYKGKTHTKKGVQTKRFQKFALGKQILIASSQLRSSINRQVGDSSVTVGTNKVYAAIHQFGGKAGRNKSVSIPARPYFPIRRGAIDDKTKQMMLKYLDKKLLKSISKK
jgi:phage virion morphogenesis protein